MMTTALLLIGLFLLLVLIVWNFYTAKRLKHFFKGSGARSLESSIKKILIEIEEIKIENKNLLTEIDELKSKLRKTVRNVQTVRFNPFPDQGGNQSFATSLLNEDGDGVVLSSLYSRDRVSVFAKPIKNKKSEYELTGEEKEVIEKSL